MNTPNDLDTCILIIKYRNPILDDFEYTKWFNPDGVPCYVKDSGSR